MNVVFSAVLQIFDRLVRGVIAFDSDGFFVLGELAVGSALDLIAAGLDLLGVPFGREFVVAAFQSADGRTLGDDLEVQGSVDSKFNVHAGLADIDVVGIGDRIVLHGRRHRVGSDVV